MLDSNQRQNYRVLAHLPLVLSRLPNANPAELYSEILTETDIVAANFEFPAISPKMEAVDWFKLVNAKLDFLIDFLQTWKKSPQNLRYYHVSLSASGLAFETEDLHAIKDIIGIKTILNTNRNLLPLQLYGEIVYFEKLKNKNRIAVNFIGLSEEISNKIATFIFEREQDMIGRRID